MKNNRDITLEVEVNSISWRVLKNNEIEEGYKYNNNYSDFSNA